MSRYSFSKKPKQQEIKANKSRQQGRELHLPQPLQKKLGNSFYADLSSVRYFEDDALASSGTRAVAQGNEVRFAPGEFNPASAHGEGLISHEISHIVSQAQGGISMPQTKSEGLTEDNTLENRADQEAYRAVKGEQIFSSPTVIRPMTQGVGPSMPMQGKTTGGANAKRKKYFDEIQELKDVENNWRMSPLSAQMRLTSSSNTGKGPRKKEVPQQSAEPIPQLLDSRSSLVHAPDENMLTPDAGYYQTYKMSQNKLLGQEDLSQSLTDSLDGDQMDSLEKQMGPEPNENDPNFSLLSKRRQNKFNQRAFKMVNEDTTDHTLANNRMNFSKKYLDEYKAMLRQRIPEWYLPGKYQGALNGQMDEEKRKKLIATSEWNARKTHQQNLKIRKAPKIRNDPNAQVDPSMLSMESKYNLNGLGGKRKPYMDLSYLGKYVDEGDDWFYDF